MSIFEGARGREVFCLRLFWGFGSLLLLNKSMDDFITWELALNLFRMVEEDEIEEEEEEEEEVEVEVKVEEEEEGEGDTEGGG